MIKTVGEYYIEHGNRLNGARIDVHCEKDLTVKILNFGNNGKLTSIVAMLNNVDYPDYNIGAHEYIKIIELGPLLEDSNKTPFHLLDLDFCAAMCENFQEGLTGDRVENGWKSLKSTTENLNKYEGALMRHFHLAKKAVLSEDRKKHLAAIACNANILWSMEGNK
jgi:hypothetical protein